MMYRSSSIASTYVTFNPGPTCTTLTFKSYKDIYLSYIFFIQHNAKDKWGGRTEDSTNAVLMTTNTKTTTSLYTYGLHPSIHTTLPNSTNLSMMGNLLSVEALVIHAIRVSRGRGTVFLSWLECNAGGQIIIFYLFRRQLLLQFLHFCQRHLSSKYSSQLE